MDLYQSPIKGKFVSYCGGNQQEENQESCVGVASVGGGFALRDTKPGAPDAELRFTAEEMGNFVRGFAREHNITL